MMDSAPATGFQPSEAAQLLNYRVTPNGDAEVRNGSKRTHSSALNAGAQGYGGTVFTTAAGVEQWVVFAGDAGYYSVDEGVSWTTIASGLRQDYWDFATMQVAGAHYLYCGNGSNTLYRWTGAAWSTVTGPATGCTRLEVHNERLWTTDGRFLYGSKIGDPSVWTTATGEGVALSFNTHDGDSAVIALYSMGLWLLVFKRKSFGYVEGYGNADIIGNAGSRGISRDVGCIAFRSLVGVGGNGLMFLSERGFEFFTPGGQPVVVSRSVSAFLETINWSDIEANPGIPTALFYPRKHTYECAIPGVAAQNDHRFVYRLPIGDRPGAASIFDSAPSSGDTVSIDADGFLQIGGGARLRTNAGFLELAAADESGTYADISSGFLELAQNDTAAAAMFTADHGDVALGPVAVGYDGFVRTLDTGLMDDLLTDGTGGVAINDRLDSRPMIFGSPFRRKRARTARVNITADTAVSPTVAIVGDGVSGTAHTLSVTASDKPTAHRIRTSVRAKELLVRIQNAGAGTRISGVAIGAELLQEKP